MLYYLKLTTPVSRVFQDGLSQTTVSGSYMTANPRNYNLGEPTSSFYVSIGKMEFDESGSATSFKRIIATTTKLTSEELSTWGSDDFEALKAVATKLNLDVESSGSAEHLYFTYN